MCIYKYKYVFIFISVYMHLNFILHIYIYTQYDICVCIQYTSFFKMTLFGPISDLNLGNQRSLWRTWYIIILYVYYNYIYIISYQTRVALGCPGLRRERIKSIYSWNRFMQDADSFETDPFLVDLPKQHQITGRSPVVHWFTAPLLGLFH